MYVQKIMLNCLNQGLLSEKKEITTMCRQFRKNLEHSNGSMVQDPNAVLEDGYTPFHLAAIFNNHGLFEQMIPLVENPFEQSQNEDNETAIILAIKYGNVSIVKIFCQNFKEDEDDVEKWLITAAYHGQVEVADYLISQFDDPIEVLEGAKICASAMGQTDFINYLDEEIAIHLFTRVFVI